MSAGPSPASLPSKASAKPLPPSPPVTTVVSDAWVDGAQQNCPSVLATAISLATVSRAPAARTPEPHRPTSAATPSARSSGEADDVGSSKPSRSGTGCGGGRPGGSGGGGPPPPLSPP